VHLIAPELISELSAFDSRRGHAPHPPTPRLAAGTRRRDPSGPGTNYLEENLMSEKSTRERSVRCQRYCGRSTWNDSAICDDCGGKR
jgi:hypothetical protein